jgi:hypothetical protein
MKIKTQNPRFEIVLIKLSAIFGASVFIAVLLVSVVLFSNSLLAEKQLNVKYRLHKLLIGNSDTAVSSLNDLYRFAAGAASGFLNGLDVPTVALSIPQAEILKLIDSSHENAKEWVSAQVSIDATSPSLRTKVRAKGDRELHKESVDSMSFRFNLKGDDRLFGMEEFSIQRPLLRGYSWELLVAKVFENHDLAVLKSVPVNFMVNGDKRGLYIVEEVPNTRMLERNRRKDGPIFGLDEKYGTRISGKLDVYDFKKWEDNSYYEYSKTLLESEFQRASDGQPFSSSAFDMEEWAKYFALSDFFGTYHGTVPKSVKFYFNPVSGVYQPILFDAHKGAGRFPDFVLLDFLLGEPQCEWICTHSNFYRAFLTNKEFIASYIKYLEIFSTAIFYNDVVNVYNQNFKMIDNHLYAGLAANDRIFNRGLSLWLFKPEVLEDRGELLRKRLVVFKDRQHNFTSNSERDGVYNREASGDLGLSVNEDVSVLRSRDIDINTEELVFDKPTLWILEGENQISGLTSEATITLRGPVMLVQLGGTLTIGKLEIINGMAVDIGNRNWSGTFNVINSKLTAQSISIVANNSEDALNIVGSEFLISSILVNEAHSDAVDFDFSNGSVDHVTCINIGNDCLDGSESMVDVATILATGIKDKVISAGESSQFNLGKVNVQSSAIALVSKDGSSLNVDQINIDGVELFAAVFNKKPEYESPSLTIEVVYGEEAIRVLKSKNGGFTSPLETSAVEVYSSEEIEAMMYGATYGVATQR